jgi:peptide/nickel transport system substrate-binding protein
VVIQSIADQQTQVARLLAGEQDLVYDVEAELAKSLAARPGIKVDIQPAVGFNFIYFDTADLSGVGVFKNKLVRKALLHAINRNDLRKALLPEKIQSEPLQQAMCNPWHIGCDSSVSPPQYDPALAKRLLAQAGYPNGFKLELTTWGPSRRVTEAVAGMLRKVGVITSVDALTIGTFRKKLRQNKIQATVSLWDNGVGQPDVDITMGFFFLSPNSKLMGDNSFKKMVFAGVKEHELDKRKAVYRKIFNRVTNEYYMMPLIQIPVVVAHHTDVKLILGHKNPHGLLFNWTAWN